VIHGDAAREFIGAYRSLKSFADYSAFKGNSPVVEKEKYQARYYFTLVYITYLALRAALTSIAGRYRWVYPEPASPCGNAGNWTEWCRRSMIDLSRRTRTTLARRPER